jgi:6-phosphofructokinase 1
MIKKKTSIKRIGILTAGGDSPGLNAAIRGVGKALMNTDGWEMVGFKDGFLGLAENRFEMLGKPQLAGILTLGGTVLGTSRDKPHRMMVDGKEKDMLDTIVANYRRHKLEALVCIGGGGTHKNALKLVEKGLRVLTLPKTIDNDVACTDSTIGFETALGIATEAIDRLHSTAHSHHRIIITEVMGHNAGWLALGAGIAGGADVILIPEIPYDVQKVASAIRSRSRHGTNFSIISVAEGAKSLEDARAYAEVEKRKKNAKTKEEKDYAKLRLTELETKHAGNTLRLARQLEELTKLESRVTILGYVQRGGTPSFADRLLATRLGTACAELIIKGAKNVMVAAKGDGTSTVPIEQVAGNIKLVPQDHAWVKAALRVGTNLGI